MSARKQRFEDRHIRDQVNRAVYHAEDELNDIDSVLAELGKTFYLNIKTKTKVKWNIYGCLEL